MYISFRKNHDIAIKANDRTNKLNQTGCRQRVSAAAVNAKVHGRQKNPTNPRSFSTLNGKFISKAFKLCTDFRLSIECFSSMRAKIDNFKLPGQHYCFCCFYVKYFTTGQVTLFNFVTAFLVLLKQNNSTESTYMHSYLLTSNMGV